MTTVLHQQYSFPSAEQLQRSWRQLKRQLDRLASPRAARPQARPTSVDLVVGGLVDEAWPYADALVDAVEETDLVMRAWWRTYGVGALELRCEVWGSGSHFHVSRTSTGVRCILQRAPETTWGGGDPAARARADVQAALLEVASTLRVPPPQLPLL